MVSPRVPRALLAVSLLVVLLGTATGTGLAVRATDAPKLATTGAPGITGEAGTGDDPRPSATQADDAPADPPSDTIGWENGYWHNESIDVSQVDGDGLTPAEQRRFMARTMARVEFLRGQEFTEDVSLRFLSRDRFRAGYANRTLPADLATERLYESFTTAEGFWEATFVYGEDENATRRVDTFAEEAVLAYSEEEGLDNAVVVVTRSEAEPAVASYVLAHELAHALQGQHLDLADARYRAATHDGRLGVDGVVEGEAAYIDSRYTARCGAEWDCIETPGNWAGRASLDQFAYPYVVSFPYADGSALVHERLEEAGWDAIDDLHRTPPASSEQVIYRDPGAVLTPLSAPDRSRDDWRLHTRERVGEATAFVMFWHQSTERDPDTVSPYRLTNTTEDFDRLNYAGEPTTGWGNDSLLLYEHGDERGYVWYTTWDTVADARAFADAYRTLLSAYDGDRRGDETWVIPPESAFADAFHVSRDGDRVRIVNAPSVDALPGLHPAATPPGTSTSTTTETSPGSATTPSTTPGASTTPSTTPGASTTPSTTPGASTTTDADGAGFGGLVAALGFVTGLLLLVAATRRRRNR